MITVQPVQPVPSNSRFALAVPFGHLKACAEPRRENVGAWSTVLPHSNVTSKLPLTIPYFWHDFSKIHVHSVFLKIKSQLPNLTSNFETHKDVGDNFYTYTSRYIHNLYTNKIGRKLKDTFDNPSHPTQSQRTSFSLCIYIPYVRSISHIHYPEN